MLCDRCPEDGYIAFGFWNYMLFEITPLVLFMEEMEDAKGDATCPKSCSELERMGSGPGLTDSLVTALHIPCPGLPGGG